MEAVTAKPGYHDISMDETGRYFVDSYSNLQTPEYTLAIYPDKTHSLRDEKTKLHVWNTERDFWRRHLGQ